jgi:glycerophosphoryl diester phosphodiesterase
MPALYSLFSESGVQTVTGLIAHALGGIDGFSYTNSREAFEASSAAGFKLFEVDLLTIADGVICYHEQDHLRLPEPVASVRRSDFLRQRYAGRFTPLDLDGLVALVAAHSQVVLLTDTKDDNRRILPRLMESARRQAPEMLARVVPQVYHRGDLEYVRQLGLFNTIVFTCYMCKYDDTQVAAMAAEPDVAMCGMFLDRFHPDLHERIRQGGASVYIHTINYAPVAEALRAHGLGIYTDHLRPEGRSKETGRKKAEGT